MIDLLDAGWARGSGYMVCAVAALWVGWRERRLPVTEREQLSLWPLYWFLTAAVLTVTGIAHLTDLGDRVAELGRSQARVDGWYEARRAAQTALVALVCAVWFVGVLMAIWRVPPRRRRYLPSAVAVATLMAFLAIRAVSLHQIDTVLYHRDVAGLRGVSIIELALLALTLLTILVRARIDRAAGEGAGGDVARTVVVG